MHGLYQRGKVWWFRFSLPGRGQVRISTGEHDEVEAIRFAREILERPERIDFGPDSFSVEVDAYIAWLAKRGVSLAHRTSNKAVLNKFLKDHGTDNPRAVTNRQVQDWLDKRLKDQNPRTALNYLQWMRRFFNWLVDAGKLRTSPCDGLIVPKVAPSVRRRFLTPAEAKKLLAACKRDDLKFCLYCALHAGLRKEEVIQARPSWFDLDEGLLHVTGDASWHPKDRDNRTIPLTNEFKKWLGRFMKKLPKGAPFMLAPKVEKGKYRYRYEFRKQYVALLDKCKIEGATFHDLRRTFASLSASRGVSLYKIARWLGDGHRVVERTYAHLTAQDAEINKAWT